jgi:hypothetical protein
VLPHLIVAIDNEKTTSADYAKQTYQMQYLAGLVKDAESLDEPQQFTAVTQTIANQYDACIHNATKNVSSRQDFESVVLQIILSLRDKNSNFAI